MLFGHSIIPLIFLLMYFDSNSLTPWQANALKQALQANEGISAHVYVAMRYWHPFTEEAVHQVSQKNETLFHFIWLCGSSTDDFLVRFRWCLICELGIVKCNSLILFRSNPFDVRILESNNHAVLIRIH